MESGFELSQDMRTWVSPSLIEANYILSLSRLELQAVIAAEMDANPALELDDRPVCPQCGTVLDGAFCPVCLVSHRRDQPTENFEDFPEVMVTAHSTAEDSDDFDPLTLVAQGEDVREQILLDARSALDPSDHPIAEYLVDSLDERGLIGCDLDELARITRRTRAQIDSVVDTIQEVAPVGVGARTLQECLLLQIAFLKHLGHDVPWQVEQIVEHYLAEFGAHRFGLIGKELGLQPEEIDAARDFIREHLSPHPLQSASNRSWRTPTASPYVAPDVVIVLRDEELVVEVVDSRDFHLKLNGLYGSLATELGKRKEAAPPPPNGHHPPRTATAAPAPASALVSDADRTHVRQSTSRARLFIANIQQRRETLLKISRCVCDLQENFLRGGVRELRPLTRAVVAQHVGVHESTVSRATANKYVMLPSRRVVPFSDFFTPSLSTKDVIKELIERETRNGEHLTDRRICDLLLDQGIRIARRTVAKYRAELGILPSTMR